MRKIKPGSPAYRRRELAALRAVAPPVVPCKQCGGPVVTGYFCRRCGEEMREYMGVTSFNAYGSHTTWRSTESLEQAAWRKVMGWSENDG